MSDIKNIQSFLSTILKVRHAVAALSGTNAREWSAQTFCMSDYSKIGLRHADFIPDVKAVVKQAKRSKKLKPAKTI